MHGPFINGMAVHLVIKREGNHSSITLSLSDFFFSSIARIA
jgi:hypothetical protein